MITKQKIKKIAQLAAMSDTIPQDIERYVLEVLTKQELKDFLRSYKNALDKKRVYISTSTSLTKNEVAKLLPQFTDKELILTTDETLGGGIKIKQDDTIMDFTFKKYINDTIEKLKN
jgi:F0F1-type ATP synthase delta subunit